MRRLDLLVFVALVGAIFVVAGGAVVRGVAAIVVGVQHLTAVQANWWHYEPALLIATVVGVVLGLLCCYLWFLKWPD